MDISRPKSLFALLPVALILMSATTASLASFESPAPGGDLRPIGNAASVVQIFQGDQAILWSTLRGPVAAIVVEGWPTVVGGSDLGGGLTIERPENHLAGAIHVASDPRSIGFELE